MSSSEFSPLGGCAGAPHRRKLAFDPTINLGHVLTFVGFIITGVSAYSTLDKRLSISESQNRVVAERFHEQEARTQESLREIKGDVKDLQRSINDITRAVNAPPRGMRQEARP